MGVWGGGTPLLLRCTAVLIYHCPWRGGGLLPGRLRKCVHSTALFGECVPLIDCTTEFFVLQGHGHVGSSDCIPSGASSTHALG